MNFRVHFTVPALLESPFLVCYEEQNNIAT
jgi:hypothetical protein